MNLINKNDSIFIAGHKGMVGSAIKRSLEQNNYNNLLLSSRDDLDLTDNQAVKNWFKRNKPDIVILAAAKVGGIYANSTYPTDFLLENLKIQNNVIESSWENDVKRFLFLGSSCIYPKNSKQPIKEEELLNGSIENTNLWYSIAKISGIKLCQALRIQYGFDSISLMPPNLYGQGDNYHQMNSHVLPALIDRFHHHTLNKRDFIECWGSGNPRREFMHVDDLADAVLFALERWDPNDKNAPTDINGKPLLLLNVGTGKDITIKSLAELIKLETGYKGIIKWNAEQPDGTFQKLLDISQISKLGWKAKIALKEGLTKTYKDYKIELNLNRLRK